MRESSIIGEAQSRTLEKRIVDNTRDADLVWSGITYKKKRTIVNNDVVFDISSSNKIATYSEDTDVNRVIYWLASETGDYGRDDPNKGANLKQYIGKILSSSNLTDFGEVIKDGFNDQFENSNIKIINLRLVADRPNKTLYIYFAVYNSTRQTVKTSAAAISS